MLSLPSSSSLQRCLLPLSRRRNPDRGRNPHHQRWTLARRPPFRFGCSWSSRSTKARRQENLQPEATRTTVKPSPDGQPASPPVSFSYRTVGTAIDCTPGPSGDGRYRVDLTISHDSISYSSDATPSPQGAPVFPTFSATNSLVLKDGETGQLTVAADPLTGDVIRVDVTLNIVK